MLRFSTGLRNAILGDTGLKGALADGAIYIYTGAQPSSADNAPTGTLLGIVTVGAGAFTPGAPTNGLEFDAPANGVVSKAVAETWQFAGLVDGTAGWFRFKANAVDADGQSTTAVRMDGTCGRTSADLVMSTVSIVSGATTTIDNFSVDMAAQA